MRQGATEKTCAPLGAAFAAAAQMRAQELVQLMREESWTRPVMIDLPSRVEMSVFPLGFTGVPAEGCVYIAEPEDRDPTYMAL